MAHTYKFKRNADADAWIQTDGTAALCAPGVQSAILSSISYDPQELEFVFTKQKPRNFEGPVFEVVYDEGGIIGLQQGEDLYHIDDFLHGTQEVFDVEAVDQGYNFIRVIIPPDPSAETEVLYFRRQSPSNSDFVCRRSGSQSITLCHTGVHSIFDFPELVEEFNVRLHKNRPSYGEDVVEIANDGCGNIIPVIGHNITLYDDVHPALRQAHQNGYRFFSLEYKQP